MDFNDRCPSQVNDNYFDVTQHFDQDNFDDLDSCLDGAIDQYKTPDLTLLAPCEFCSRTFLPTSLTKHKRVCYKNWCKYKEKTENNCSDKPYSHPYGYGGDKSILTIEKMLAKRRHRRLNWRLRHEEFLRAVHAARDYAEAVASGNPLPPPLAPLIEPDLKQCPYCHRRFHEKSHEKHVKRCKEQSLRSNREKPSYQTMEAKRRLAVRLYYTPNSRPNSCLPMSVSPTPSSLSRPSSRQSELDFAAYSGRYSSLSAAEKNFENRFKIPDHIFDNINKTTSRRTPRASSTDCRKSTTPTSQDIYANAHLNYNRSNSRTNSSMSDNYTRAGNARTSTPSYQNYRNTQSRASNRPRQQPSYQQQTNYPNYKQKPLSRAPSEQSLTSNSSALNRSYSTLYNNSIDNSPKKHVNNKQDSIYGSQNSLNSNNIKRSTSFSSDKNKKSPYVQRKQKEQTNEYTPKPVTSTFKQAQVRKPFSCARPSPVEAVNETTNISKHNKSVKVSSKIAIEKKHRPEEQSRPNSGKSNRSENSTNISSDAIRSPSISNMNKRTSNTGQKLDKSRNSSLTNSTENLEQLLLELKRESKHNISNKFSSIEDNERNITCSPLPVAPQIQVDKMNSKRNRVRNEMQIRIKPAAAQILEPDRHSVSNSIREEVQETKNVQYHKQKHQKRKSQDSISMNSISMNSISMNSISMNSVSVTNDLPQNPPQVQSPIQTEMQPQIQSPIQPQMQLQSQAQIKDTVQTYNTEITFQNSLLEQPQVIHLVNPKGESPSSFMNEVQLNAHNYVTSWNKAQGDNNELVTSHADFSNMRSDKKHKNDNQNNGLRISSATYQSKTHQSVPVTESVSNTSKRRHRHQRKTSSSSNTNPQNQNVYKSTINLNDAMQEKSSGRRSRNHSNTSCGSNNFHSIPVKADNCTGCGYTFPNPEANFCGCCGIKRSFV